MSNKIHLGNTKILANESAEAGTEVTTPNRSGTLALLTDIDGSEGGSGSGDWYTKAEIDSQQAVQDLAINNNAEDIKDNTDKIQVNSDKNASQDAAILLNSTNINNNKIAIQTNSDEIEKLTGAIIYKGSIDATKTPAPVDARVGDMWINKYNPEFPNKYYTVTGWGSLTGVKFDDRLVKTETDWDRIENSTSSSYLVADDCIYLNKQEITNDYIMPAEFNGMTAGPLNVKADVSIPEGSEWSVIGSGGGGGGDAVDAYTKTETDTKLDLKADKSDTYTKTATDTLLDSKANVGDSYTKSETYSNVEVDAKLFTKADKETTYTKDEVDTIVGEGGGGDADLSAQVTQHKNDIIELEAEIEAISPSLLRGRWLQHIEETSSPAKGHYLFKDKNSVNTKDCREAAHIYISFNDKDDNDGKNTLKQLRPGTMVEVFDSASDSYLLGIIKDSDMFSDFINITISSIASQGSMSDSEEPGARVKFFQPDASKLVTLTSGIYTFKATGRKALGQKEFGVDNASIKDAQEYYFSSLYDAIAGSRGVRYYVPTPSTELMIYHENELLMRSPIKEWGYSIFSSTDVQFKLANKTPIIYKRDCNYDFSGSETYGVFLTNLRSTLR